MTYSEIYNSAISQLSDVCKASEGTLSIVSADEAKSNADLLFYYLLNMSKSDLFMRANEEIADGDVKKINDAIALREKHVPLQHITGVQEFMGLEFDVSKDVLIPRFDTECLVEEAMLVTNDGYKVLDVCTGSGCVIISLMQYKNDISGFASDISDKALSIAKANALKHNKSISFIKSDMFNNIEEKDFDVILCNPPYIKTGDINNLMDEVKLHDPINALDGGEDGLVYIRLLAEQAAEYLKPYGYLLTEIGFDQGKDAADIFKANGYIDVKVVKDLAGNDRVVAGRLNCGLHNITN